MTIRSRFPWLLFIAISWLASTAGCDKPAGVAGIQPVPAAPGAATPPATGKTVLRVGYFPNITHAQAIIAHALTRQGKGWFEERLGSKVDIQWSVYSAGPAAIDAILAKSLDLTYVGPSPALNAYAKSGGEEIRIIAGSAVGGAALVVQGDGRIKAPADFRRKRVATPQLGNTQDVACRSWLIGQGFDVTHGGGDVRVQPTPNTDQLSLFQKKELDAVWTVEPWVSRLELEAGGKVFLEEDGAITTILVSSANFLKEQRPLADQFARAHAELTDWIIAHPAEAQRLLREELVIQTKSEISEELVKRGWSRLRLTKEIQIATLEKLVADAKQVGFLKELVDLSKLIDVRP